MWRIGSRIAALGGAALAGVVAIALVSCASQPKKRPKQRDQRETSERARSVEAHEVKSVKLPKSALIGDNVTLSGFMEDAVPQREESGPEQGRGVVERAGQPASAVKDVYRRVAPATVIVRAGPGYGSGVVYDPAGWILTNHHVVAHAENEDFRWKVQVTLGKLDKRGSMHKRDKVYEAYVHKMDPLLDLAVIKLVDPPKDLKAIAVSPSDPAPGEAVSALGHAGIGLVWAIKDGQISAVGKLSTHLAQLMLYAAGKHGHKSPPTTSGRHELMQRIRAKQLERYRKFLEQKKPALVIQSTCDISQGDSGGPLVNRRSELVGLNAFVRSVGRARKESNFHIHVKEIRSFIEKVPAKAPQLLPDPWSDGGTYAKMGDGDLDGKVDVLVMYKVRRLRFFRRTITRRQAMAYFVDLDQSSFAKGATLPSTEKVVEKRSFEPEMIFLQHGSHLYAWYDTDNDGKRDVLLVAGAHTKRVEAGYRLDAKGNAKRDPALMAGPLVRPSLLSDPRLGQRLVAVGARVFHHRLLPKGAVAEKARYPDPINGAGHQGKLYDYTHDGKPDTARARGLFSHGYIVDIDQNTFGGFKTGDSWRQVRRAHQVDAEFSWISHKRSRWAWYDTDDDGRFDLLLHATSSPYTIVDDAWTVAKSGKFAPAASQKGRMLVQPELIAAHAAPLRALARRIVGRWSVAKGAGIDSFPDPGAYYTYRAQLVSAGRRYRDVAAKVRAYGGCRHTLVDVDRDTRRAARKDKLTIEQMVKAKRFDAEFAQVRCRRRVWTFYDTRGKGKYDLVLYSERAGKGKATAVYRVTRSGELKRREKPLGCNGLIHPRLFSSRKLRRHFARIAPKLFKNLPDKRCKP